MITGTHFLLHSRNAEADRAFFRDVLGLSHVDVGEGWLIFRMPPAEAGIHPSGKELPQGDGDDRMLGADLYLISDDLKSEIASLKKKNVECTEVVEAGWGRKTTISLPSGGVIGLYQPRHATAFNLKQKVQNSRTSLNKLKSTEKSWQKKKRSSQKKER